MWQVHDDSGSCGLQIDGHDGTLLEAYLGCEPTYTYMAANSRDQGLTVLLRFTLGTRNDGLSKSILIDWAYCLCHMMTVPGENMVSSGPASK